MRINNEIICFALRYLSQVLPIFDGQPIFKSGIYQSKCRIPIHYDTIKHQRWAKTKKKKKQFFFLLQI